MALCTDTDPPDFSFQGGVPFSEWVPWGLGPCYLHQLLLLRLAKGKLTWTPEHRWRMRFRKGFLPRIQKSRTYASQLYCRSNRYCGRWAVRLRNSRTCRRFHCPMAPLRFYCATGTWRAPVSRRRRRSSPKPTQTEFANFVIIINY